MAERRMFSLKITNSDAFKMMSPAAQALYFHLGMAADDDGVANNALSIARSIGVDSAALDELLRLRFLLDVGDGVYVIKHWKINNYIQKDRYKPTTYPELLQKLTLKSDGIYTEKDAESEQTDTDCIQNVSKVDTGCTHFVHVGKDSIDNITLFTNVHKVSSFSAEKDGESAPEILEKTEKKQVDFQKIVELYNETCPDLIKCVKLTEARKSAIKGRLSDGYTIEDFKKAFELAQASDFLAGRTDTGFKADFDFIFARSKLQRILEGSYNKNNKNNKQKQTDLSDVDESKLRGINWK